MKVQLPLVALIGAATAAFSVQALSGSATGPVVCGGIGADQRAAFEAQGQGANLALEFFVANRGDYLADVDLAVVPLDARSGAAPIRITTDGPLCFVSVPPGRYRIDATYNGATRSVRTTVRARGGAPIRVAMAFPEDVVPDDGGIRPTPEEKQEAKTP